MSDTLKRPGEKCGDTECRTPGIETSGENHLPVDSVRGCIALDPYL